MKDRKKEGGREEKRKWKERNEVGPFSPYHQIAKQKGMPGKPRSGTTTFRTASLQEHSKAGHL